MVIHSNRQITFSVVLTYHILVQKSLNILRLRQIFLFNPKELPLPGFVLLLFSYACCAHSSQIAPEIPLINILTSRLPRPQNVQLSPVLAIPYLFFKESTLKAPVPAFDTRDKGLLTQPLTLILFITNQNLVDHTVSQSFLCRHPIVTVTIVFNLFIRLT